MRFPSESPEGENGSSTRIFEDGLSPCSRGLLAGALTDVVDGASSSRFCDVSPDCEYAKSSRPQQKVSPEELLRKAISIIPTAADAGSAVMPSESASSSTANTGRTTRADLLCCRTACSSGSEVDESVFSETSARRGLEADFCSLRLPAESL